MTQKASSPSRPKIEPQDARTIHASGVRGDITAEAWWYETPEGVLVVAEHRTKDAYLGASQHLITWAQIRSALARKDGR